MQAISPKRRLCCLVCVSLWLGLVAGLALAQTQPQQSQRRRPVRRPAKPPTERAISVGSATPTPTIAPSAPLAVPPKRVALVIGNAAYRQRPLPNPAHDAQAMAATLRTLGFEVILSVNATQLEMQRVLKLFNDKLAAGGVALFYFAGHGLQVEGRNYLIPINASITTETDVSLASIPLDTVLTQMKKTADGINLVILDACRNNPFIAATRGMSLGLAPVERASGTLIAYATAPGQVASDGVAGRNGLYTQELLQAMRAPGIAIEEVFKRTRNRVEQLSHGAQTPWEHSSLKGDFSFLPTVPALPPVASVTPPVASVPPVFDAAVVEQLFRTRRYDEVIARCQAALAQQPNEPAALLYLGQSYFVQQQFDAALPYLTQAWQQDAVLRFPVVQREVETKMFGFSEKVKWKSGRLLVHRTGLTVAVGKRERTFAFPDLQIESKAADKKTGPALRLRATEKKQEYFLYAPTNTPLAGELASSASEPCGQCSAWAAALTQLLGGLRL